MVQAHGVDEFMSVRNLRDATLALAMTLADARLKEAPRLESTNRHEHERARAG